MPAGSCIPGTICKYENGTLKVARNAFNIWEVWNPVCCHGNKTVRLVLWSTFSTILLQRIKHFWNKFAEMSFFVIFDQNLVESIWRHHLASLHILKIEYLWNEKRYLEIVNGIFPLLLVYILKWLRLEWCNFLHRGITNFLAIRFFFFEHAKRKSRNMPENHNQLFLKVI